MQERGRLLAGGLKCTLRGPATEILQSRMVKVIFLTKVREDSGEGKLGMALLGKHVLLITLKTYGTLLCRQGQEELFKGRKWVWRDQSVMCSRNLRSSTLLSGKQQREE